MADPKAPKAVVSPTGKVGYLPEEFAQDAAAAGVRQATVAELAAAQAQADADARRAMLAEKYDVEKHPLDAYLGQLGASHAAVARGLTLGLSDVALSKLGGEDARKKLLELQEAHPLTSGAMEMAGTVGSMAAGGAVGGAALRAAGLAAVAPTTAVGRIAAGAASAGAEMGLYGAGKEASREALAGEELNAQKIIASGAHEGLWGLALGAPLAAAGEGLLALRSARGAAREVSEVAAERAEAAAPKGGIGDMLQKEADVRTIKGLGGSAADIRRIESTVDGGYRRVAQDLRADVQSATGKSVGRLSREELNEYAEKRVSELGKKLGTMLEDLDAAKTGIAPDAKAFVESVRKDVLGRYMVETPKGAIPAPGARPIVEKVEDFLGQVEAAAADKSPTFKQWQQWRVNLDKLAKFEKAAASPAEEALRSARGIMEGQLEAAGDRAAAQMGGSFSAEYKATKSLYQSVLKASELTERGVSRDLVNNSFGLTSRMAAIAGFSSASIPGAIAGAAIGKLAQRLGPGDMLAADLLDRAAGVLGVRAVAARTEAAVARGIGNVVGKAANDNAAGIAPPRVTPKRPPGTPREQYAKISEQLRQVATNPERTVENVSRSVGNMHDLSPRMSDALVATVLRGTDYLRSKLPKGHTDPYALQPQLQKERVADADVSRFMRQYDIVNSPLTVFDEVRKGTLTREHVEALKVVYPDLYAELRSQVVERLVETKTELPYRQRIQLGILLDIPSDKSLSPAFQKAIQATYPNGAEAGAESPPQQDAPRLKLSDPTMTATEAAASRL